MPTQRPLRIVTPFSVIVCFGATVHFGHPAAEPRIERLRFAGSWCPTVDDFRPGQRSDVFPIKSMPSPMDIEDEPPPKPKREKKPKPPPKPKRQRQPRKKAKPLTESAARSRVWLDQLNAQLY